MPDRKHKGSSKGEPGVGSREEAPGEVADEDTREEFRVEFFVAAR